MTSLQIETISDDNKKSLFRSQRIKLSGKESITPLKALDASKLRTSTTLNSDAYGLLELYKPLSSEKISILSKNQDEHDRFSRSLVNLSKKGKDNDLNICILKYTNPNLNPFPIKNEIEFLTDVAYCNSDITPIPMLDTKIDDSNFARLLKYIETSFSIINQLNHKPIMGYLPNLPREFFPKLLDFYLDKEITAFYFDFNGQTPDHLKLRPILRHLNLKKKLDKSVIYGLNAKPGRALKQADVIPSKDFVAYGYGLDMLGQSHVALKRPKEFFEKLKKAIDNQQENKKRLFSKQDYGYYKIGKRSEIESMFPKDSSISVNEIITDNYKTYQNLFNMEQQGIESAILRNKLNKLDPNETILKYIVKKIHINKEMKHLERGPKTIQ